MPRSKTAEKEENDIFLILSFDLLYLKLATFSVSSDKRESVVSPMGTTLVKEPLCRNTICHFED